jgi:moderate conductance mechanosensitive channel
VAPPIEQWNVRREFLKRLKEAYEQRGIEIPFPQLRLHAPFLEQNAASKE